MVVPRPTAVHAALLLTLGAVSCEKSKAAPAPSASADSPSPRASAVPPSQDAGVADAASPTSALPKARTDGCPDGMVRVEGDYCPAVIQDCEEHHPEYLARKGDPTVSERCNKYKPSKCLSKERVELSFCIDRYEYPNRTGEMPWVLTSWLQAREKCEKIGKRLCTEDEFNFACEGPEMLPYVYGQQRDPNKCNIDKPYRQPDQSRQLKTYEKCPDDAFCSSEMKRLDQRHAIGSTHSCVSWAGVVDMNGNVNEWVELPGKEHPNRSGLKGGWWGPVRNRCRPTVKFHKEFDYGYEAGFRCCTDAKETGKP
ncbi:MAG: SUMF1/EgtB/PvdO family nonheme iron enzyme [Polyangiaceae bacterium]